MSGIDPKALEGQLVRFAEKIGPLFVEDIREFFANLPPALSTPEPKTPDVEPVGIVIRLDGDESVIWYEGSDVESGTQLYPTSVIEQLRTRAEEAEAAVAVMHGLLENVIEAAERSLGDHVAPHDCFATGPLTGNPIADLVACPGCTQINEIARAKAALSQENKP